MDNDDILNVAKEAYALSQQLHELESAMLGKNSLSGYSAYANNYNAILDRSKKILELDKTLLSTIDHLKHYDPQKAYGYVQDFEEIKANIATLKATLRTFFEFNFPKKEKERMGFQTSE